MISNELLSFLRNLFCQKKKKKKGKEKKRKEKKKKIAKSWSVTSSKRLFLVFFWRSTPFPPSLSSFLFRLFLYQNRPQFTLLLPLLPFAPMQAQALSFSHIFMADSIPQCRCLTVRAAQE